MPIGSGTSIGTPTELVPERRGPGERGEDKKAKENKGFIKVVAGGTRAARRCAGARVANPCGGLRRGGAAAGGCGPERRRDARAQGGPS